MVVLPPPFGPISDLLPGDRYRLADAERRRNRGHMPTLQRARSCAAQRARRADHGTVRPENTAAGFAAGVTDYLTKPFRPAHVRARVQAWLLRRPAEAPRDT